LNPLFQLSVHHHQKQDGGSSAAVHNGMRHVGPVVGRLEISDRPVIRHLAFVIPAPQPTP
jgi:hypothetical protein